MPIVWRKEMAIGHQVVDDEHKLLICLINSVEIALRADDHDNIILFLIRELHGYTQSHFAQEEKIMVEHSFGGYREHKQAHQKILHEIEELEKSVKAAMASEQGFNAEQMNLVPTLRSWIIDHVLQMDMKMKPLFHSR